MSKIEDVMNEMHPPELSESSEVKGDTWAITLPKSRVHTLDELVKFFEIDLTVWEVERFVANKWEMGYIAKTTKGPVRKDKSQDIHNTAGYEELYQVKAFLRRRKDVESARKEIEALFDLAKVTVLPPKEIKKRTGRRGGMLEINLTDHHFGKLAWQLETLFANYDVKIATAVFHRAMDALIERSPYATYEQIWFVIGNDLFNADNTEGTTTAGTQVQSDVRHRKTYVTVRTLIVRAIEKLRYFADKIVVVVVPGNHDYNTTWHLGDALELYFSKYPDVEIDNSPAERKYHEYGDVLIGYTHGDKVRSKEKELPMLMATEARDAYGRTKFHEWHIGHTHETRTTEYHGIRVRILPALCPPDKWHSEMGFVGNLRSSEAYHWDKHEGLTHIIIYTDSDDLIEKASTTPTAVKE